MVKIPNYDTHSSQAKSERRCNGFLDEEYRMLVVTWSIGVSSSEKTRAVMHMLGKPLVYYDKIFLYTANPYQKEIQDLQKEMDRISQKVGYDVLVIIDPNKIMDTNEYPEGRKVVIFDDLVNAPRNIQSKIANHFTDGRHHQISPIYLTQSYYDLPEKLRLNCSHIILYAPPMINYNLIMKEHMIEPGLFKSLDPFDFLFVDKEKKKVAKNFNEKI